MELHPGDIILNGKYRVERLLGKGAFAWVYLVHHLELDVDRAVKVLSRDAPGVGSTQFGDYHDRFRLEAQLGARLDHPCVIKVYDFETQEGALHLVMEYAPGGSLSNLLEQGPLSLGSLLRIALDAAIGLGAIHDQLEIVHRDVKPSNILLTEDYRAKIGDLGLAQTESGFSRRSQLGSLAAPHPGTPLYMSPEQEREYGYLQYPSDVYGLGCVMFEMFTGKGYKKQRPGTRMSQLREDVPEWLDELVARCLSKEREERPWNGNEVAEVLRGGKLAIEEQAEQEQEEREGREQAGREAEAAQWRTKMEEALRAGEWRMVETAVGQLLAVAPGDPDGLAARDLVRQQLVVLEQPEQEPVTTPAKVGPSLKPAIPKRRHRRPQREAALKREARAVVTLEHVSKRFGDVVAVSDLNLTIVDGEFLAIVGPSGCGKSTVLHLLAGSEKITEGNIYIVDRLVNDVPPNDRNVAMVVEDYGLDARKSAYDNMAVDLKARRTPKAEIDRRVKAVSEVLGISALLDRKPTQLSVGQRHRIALGRAIVSEPHVFLLDNVLAALDPRLRADARVSLIKLNQKLETPFILATSDYEEAMAVATRVAVMRDGTLQQVDTPQNVYEFPNNLFVAGFMGAPSMNFFNGTLALSEGDIYVDTSDFRIQMPRDEVNVYGPYAGKGIIMGIRPEDIYDPEHAPPDINASLIEAKVELVEWQGKEAVAHLTTSESGFLASVDSLTGFRTGDQVQVLVDIDSVHIFDQMTEMAIR